MELKINHIKSKEIITKSNLPASDYVINPYVGCLHACKYCYASFMKRFTGHTEPWGTFLDVKNCDKKLDLKKLQGKTVFMSSVTDCYNPLEKTEMKTREILKQLASADCKLTITTKSPLVLRDVDLLKELKDVEVALSINTLDEVFRADMDRAGSIQSRIETLEKLHENGIKTVLFMSPIFPALTDFKSIIEKTKAFTDEYWFENLNLRGEYKFTIMNYIRDKHPNLFNLYSEIYYKNSPLYWNRLESEIRDYCHSNNISHQIFFHHSQN